MKTISYKGKLADGGIDTLALHTIKGKIGYKITKFQVMGPDANTNTETVVKVYSTKQTTASNTVDFTDNTLLAAAIYNDTNDPHYLAGSVITFDNETFNQDIFITNKGHDNTSVMNYYLELEQIALSDLEATMATLKDIRAIES